VPCRRDVAGTVAQTLAEALAGMALDTGESGRAVVLGQFASSLSMQSGRADLRYARARAGSVHHARWRGGWECRSVRRGTVRCQDPDAQAPMSRPTLIPLSGRRQLRAAHAEAEGGLAMGYEKFVRTPQAA